MKSGDRFVSTDPAIRIAGHRESIMIILSLLKRTEDTNHIDMMTGRLAQTIIKLYEESPNAISETLCGIVIDSKLRSIIDSVIKVIVDNQALSDRDYAIIFDQICAARYEQECTSR